MHFGFYCHTGSSHVDGLVALALHLQERGHRATLFQIAPEFESAVRRAGLDFHPFDTNQNSPETKTQPGPQSGKPSGLSGTHRALHRTMQYTATAFREGPAIIKSTGVDALIIDQIELAGPTIAERLGLPFVTVSICMPTIPDLGQPPTFTTWSYLPGPLGRLRNRWGYKMLFRKARPFLEMDDAQRHAWGLPSRLQSLKTRLGDINQLPACFDFPRKTNPRFFYTGPFLVGAARAEVPFPWDRLDGRPLIFAALGTLPGRVQAFQIIAQASAGLDAQLVLSLSGGGVQPAELGGLPGNPVIVSYAPQLELIKRAALVITHAGLSTTLECLSFGVPMVAIPFTHDQPGVAARIAWHGAGEFVPHQKLSAPRLRGAMERVLLKSSCKKSAERLQAQIPRDGLRQAGDIIERVFNVSTAAKSAAAS